MIRDDRPFYRAAGRGNRGGRYRGGRNFRQTKRTSDPPVDPQVEWNRQLRQTFTLVGDFSKRNENSASLAQNVIAIISALESQGLLDGGDQTQDLADMMVKAGGSLGMQTPVYALMTALCAGKGKGENGGETTFGHMVLDGTCSALIRSMQIGAFIQTKLLIRFLGELVNCRLIRAAEFGDLLTAIVTNYVSNIQMSQPCRDVLAAVVIAALPWCGPVLHSSWVSGFSVLMDQLRMYMENRCPLFKNRGLRGVFHTSEEFEHDVDSEAGNDVDEESILQSKPTPESLADSLESLWISVCELNEAGWIEADESESLKTTSICRPYRDSCVAEQLELVTEISLPDDLIGPRTVPPILTQIGPLSALSCIQIENNKIISFPSVSVSPMNTMAYAYAFGALGEFDLFHEGSGGFAGKLSQLTKVVRTVLREYVKDALAAFQPIIKEDGTATGRYDTMASQLLSIGKLIPENEGIGPYLVVEVLIEMIISLPQIPYMTAFIHRTFLELCRFAPTEVAPAISSATGALFHEIPRMDFHSRKQLAEWFANHLKDTEFRWPFWQHWANVAQDPPDSPQRLFVSMALDTLVRLSYMERIQKDLPEELWPLLPPPATIVCPYNKSEESVADSLGLQIVLKMKSKESKRDVEEWLLGELNSIDSSEEVKSDFWVVSAITNAILLAGAPTPTHLQQALDRYIDFLTSIIADSKNISKSEETVLQTIRLAWKNSPQNVVVVTKLFLVMGVISPESIVSYFFLPENLDTMAYASGLWDILEAAIRLVLDAVITIEEKNADVDFVIDHESEDEIENNTGILSISRLELLKNFTNEVLKGFANALSAAVHQYELSNFDLNALYQDFWWIAMSSHFKAAVRMLFSVPIQSQSGQIREFLDDTSEALNAGLGENEKVKELFEFAKIAWTDMYSMIDAFNL